MTASMSSFVSVDVERGSCGEDERNFLGGNILQKDTTYWQQILHLDQMGLRSRTGSYNGVYSH